MSGDTGTARSCMSESCYNTLMHTNLKQSPNVSVRSTSGAIYIQ